MKLLLLLTIFSITAEAQTLPDSTPSLSNIIQEFRPKFATMISNLKVNFLYDLSKNQARFYTNVNLNCAGKSLKAGETLAKITYNVSDNVSNKMVETISYFGCNDTLYLVEEIITFNSKAKPMGIATILNGVLDFSIQLPEFQEDKIYLFNFSSKMNHTQKIYRLKDANNTLIFSSNEKIIDTTQKDLTIYVLGERVMHQIIKTEAKKMSASHAFNWMPLIYTFNGDTWRWTLPTTSTQIFISSAENSPLLIIGQDRSKRLSEQNFIEEYTAQFINKQISTTKRIIGDFTKFFFPETELVNAGGTNNRFLNELLRMRFLLESGTPANINLVRQQLNAIIDGIQKSLINVTDNREN